MRRRTAKRGQTSLIRADPSDPCSSVFHCFRGPPQLAVQFRQASELVMRVQSARVRQDPHRRLAELFRLPSQFRLWPTERGAIRRHPEKGDHPRPIALHLPRQPACPVAQLFVTQLVGGRGRGIGDVGNAVSVFEKASILRRVQPPVGEAGGMQRRPEAVAGPREVVADRGGLQTRVDADEENFQTPGDDVGNATASRGRDLGGRRLLYGTAGHPIDLPRGAQAVRRPEARCRGRREEARAGARP